MAAISTLTVNLIARTSSFEKGMGRASKKLSFVQQQAKATRNAMMGMVTGMVAMAATMGSIDLFKNFINAASFAVESGNRFKEVFKLQASSAEQFADRLAVAVGRSKTNLKDLMATLQDTFVPLGIVRKKGAELSGQLVQLAIDVASFKDVADEKVLNDFTGALVGQSKAVLKYGIVTNITALKQELLRLGITKTFEALSTQEKVMLRFNVIMKSTKDAQGDAIRTARSHANMVKRMKSAYEEFQVTLGKKMMPTMTDLVEVSLKVIAVAEKINFNTVASVGRYAAAAVGVLALAKGLRELTVLTKGAVAAGFLWSGGLKRIAFRLRITTAAIMANTAALGLYVLAIGTVTIGLDAMNRTEAAAIRNSARFWKIRDDILRQAIRRQKDLKEEIAATKRQATADRFAAGGMRRQQFLGSLPDEETKKRMMAQTKALVAQGKALTREVMTPMERYKEQMSNINELIKKGAISYRTFGRAARNALKELVGVAGPDFGKLDPLRPSFPQTADFGERTSPDVSLKGLSIGAADGGIRSELQKQTGYLALIAGKEALG